MKNGTTIDFFVLIIFFFILVGIGFYFSKLMKSGKDYFSGGNKVPWWASGISMFTASFSAWSFTGAAGFVYQTEWLGIFYFATWSVGCIIGSYMTAARWRRTRGISPVEYTKTRYNQVTQQVIGYVILLNAILSLGIGLTAVSKIISYSMNIPIEVVIIVSGAAVLVYTFLGGIWAVTVADVLKFFIIIGITIIILPLALNLVGGFGPLLNGLSKINLDQTYKGEGYNFTWIMSIILINIFTSANSAQKFYSVRDEKSARKVGLMCGLLFLAVPLLFGVPPLVAKILWPDLSKIAFFQTQSVPAESVFIAIVLKVLPNGLIGVFLAAMLAATFSALDSAYNSTAAILAKDLYGGIFRPNATGKQIMTFGRIATFVIGGITIIMALIYSQSKFGLFNWMMTFASLFFLPMTIPLVLGLLVKSMKRWSGFATILIGLCLSVVDKFLLGMPFGAMNISVMLFCTIFIVSSNSLAKIYKANKYYSVLLSLGMMIFLSIFFNLALTREISIFENYLLYVVAIIISASIFIFSRLFASETDEDEATVNNFFKQLSTPINVIEEVYSKGIKEVSTFPFIGKMAIFMGFLIGLLCFFGMNFHEITITLSLSLILIIVGSLLVYFGGRSEKKYVEKMEEVLRKAQL